MKKCDSLFVCMIIVLFFEDERELFINGVIKATLLLFLQVFLLFILNNKIGGVGWKH